MLEDTGDTEISNFYGSILIHKNILSLQISVQNLSVMNMLYCQCHLYEPVQDLIFAIAYFTYLFLVRYFRIKVTTVSIVHDDTETAFVHE